MSHAFHALDPADNVAVALRDVAAGEAVAVDSGVQLTTVDAVASGHKVALRAIPAGEPVVKYGHVIGVATASIAVGQHVHSHNLAFVALAPGAGHAEAAPTAATTLPTRRTWQGIRRSDGRVATRNYLAVVSTVNCSATVSRAIAARAEASGLVEQHPGIDGVVALTHEQGCGHGGPDGLALLRRTLAGYACHPNVGGVVVVGLGCEMNQLEHVVDAVNFRPEVPVARFTIQEVGGTKPAIARGLAELTAMAPAVGRVQREDVPVSQLVVGLNCGASDGWSSVTANPALGVASDLIVAQGGTTVLAETPEIYGAEDLLLARAVGDDVRAALLERLRWWESYTAAAGGSLDNNPSPGNKAGGITTILEKSLGAVAKSGHAPLQAVYGYAEPITASGLCFMDTPGYDPASLTGLIAGGCTLNVFTTGRGSAIGTRPAPTLKLATNSELARRMPGDIDLDTGDIIERGVAVTAKGHEIYEAILDAASGRLTASEELGYGDDEFVPWHLGAVT